MTHSISRLLPRSLRIWPTIIVRLSFPFLLTIDVTHALEIVTDCSTLFQEKQAAPQLPESLPASTDSTEIIRERKAHVRKIEQLLKTENTETLANELKKIGIPGYFYPAETYSVYRIDLEAESADATLRSVKRLKNTWQKKGKPFPDIEIAFISPDAMNARGFYSPDKNLIRIALSVWLEEFPKNNFPTTLSHELRHATFEHFEKQLKPQQMIYRTQLTPLSARKLRAGPYAKFLSLEEAYTFPRKLRTEFQNVLATLNVILGTSDYLLSSKATAFHENIDGLLTYLKMTKEIVDGAHLEFEEAYHHLLNRQAKLSVPFGKDYGVIEVSDDDIEQAIRIVFPCPDCSRKFYGFKTFGDKKKAMNYLEQLRTETQSRLEKIKKTVGEATTSLERIQTRRYNNDTNYRKIMTEFEEARKKIVKLLQEENQTLKTPE